jgi:D-xylose reductase
LFLSVEYHPYLQQRRLVEWVKKQDIHFIAYASFGPTAFSKVPENIAHFPSLLKHPVAEKIAEKHSISAAQVVLKWAVQHEVVVIPKSVNVQRMKTNLDLYSFTLDQEDMKAMDDLEANARFNQLTIDAYGFELPMFD